MLNPAEIDIVLVHPRNPLNIGAVARAMANFGFSRLSLVAPFDPHWQEARSAIGAEDLLHSARVTESLAEAVANCTLVLGTGSLAHRKPEQRVLRLPDLAPLLEAEQPRQGRIALVFGPEKHGLTREDLSYCHILIEIPTDPRQPSMNLGQAVAVCLYELVRASHPCAQPIPRSTWDGSETPPLLRTESERLLHARSCAPSIVRTSQNGSETPALDAAPEQATTSGSLDRLATLIEETMLAAGYSPRSMQAANRHDLRLLLRRLAPAAQDTRRILGLFRRILWKLSHSPKKDSEKVREPW